MMYLLNMVELFVMRGYQMGCILGWLDVREANRIGPFPHVTMERLEAMQITLRCSSVPFAWSFIIG